MLLEAVAHSKIAEFGRVPVPGDRVAAGPVAGRHGADIKRHANAVALVEAGPTRLGKVPAGAEIARPPRGIGLEAAAGEHDSPRTDFDRALLDPCAHAPHAGVVGKKGMPWRSVVDGDARLRSGPVERLDEARPAAPGFDRKPAPEAKVAVLPLERLAAVARLKAHALLAHPEQGAVAAGDELLHEVRVGAVLGKPCHVVVIVGLGVGAEIGLGQLALGEVGHQRAERVGPAKNHSHGACGICAVAAALFLRRGLQQPHARPGLRRRKRCRERGVAAAHDHDIGLERLGHPTSTFLAVPPRTVRRDVSLPGRGSVLSRRPNSGGDE